MTINTIADLFEARNILVERMLIFLPQDTDLDSVRDIAESLLTDEWIDLYNVLKDDEDE